MLRFSHTRYTAHFSNQAHFVSFSLFYWVCMLQTIFNPGLAYHFHISTVNGIILSRSLYPPGALYFMAPFSLTLTHAFLFFEDFHVMDKSSQRTLEVYLKAWHPQCCCIYWKVSNDLEIGFRFLWSFPSDGQVISACYRSHFERLVASMLLLLSAERECYLSLSLKITDNSGMAKLLLEHQPLSESLPVTTGRPVLFASSLCNSL